VSLQELGLLANALVALLVVVIGLIIVPRVRNTISDQMAVFDEKFTKLEETAHADIVRALDELKQDFHRHNTDDHAHPNLAVFSKLETKLEEVRAELVELRMEILKRSPVPNRWRSPKKD
jgi:uncharacterized membrane protein YhiD involved in acid resistance